MAGRFAFGMLTVIALLFMWVISYDYYSRYKSWRSLSPDLIPEASQWYVENRAWDVAGISAVCVYALDCSEDRARLAIVRDPDQYDFEALRQLIWARRFEDVCQGQTANLGLHLLRSPGSEVEQASDHAFWSFYHNRFIPKNGTWSSGAFSEEPWEGCSLDGAAYLLQDGVLVKSEQ